FEYWVTIRATELDVSSTRIMYFHNKVCLHGRRGQACTRTRERNRLPTQALGVCRKNIHEAH
ncbi:MAG TPA: hypothetical protein VF932_15210, partial [Anaerolineae bacterium]